MVDYFNDPIWQSVKYYTIMRDYYDVLINYEPPQGGYCGSTICAAESHASRGRSEHAAREVNLGPSLMQAHCSS